MRNRSPINLRALLTEYGIDSSENPNGKWLNLSCPFCSDSGQHLGFNLEKGFFTCFKCGSRREYETVAALLNVDLPEARRTCEKFRAVVSSGSKPYNAVKRVLHRPRGNITLPKASVLTHRHREYLRERGFNPKKLEAEWGLLGTDHLGKLAHRIIIPVHENERIVCWQARDITDKAKAKYLSCPDEEAVVSIKDCLYGIDKCVSDSVMVTEGPTKVWRLGAGSVATFGATVTSAQVRKLCKFRTVFILFDDDDAGLHGAEVLANQLAVAGRQVQILWTQGIADPSDLSQKDADELMRSLKIV